MSKGLGKYTFEVKKSFFVDLLNKVSDKWYEDNDVNKKAIIGYAYESRVMESGTVERLTRILNCNKSDIVYL